MPRAVARTATLTLDGHDLGRLASLPLLPGADHLFAARATIGADIRCRVGGERG
jgi:hypothetical protein